MNVTVRVRLPRASTVAVAPKLSPTRIVRAPLLTVTLTICGVLTVMAMLPLLLAFITDVAVTVGA